MPRSIHSLLRSAPFICAVLFFTFGLAAALAAPARGEGLYLFPKGSPGARTPAPVVAGIADIAVNGITGRTTVRQTFLNPEKSWVEGIYVFPLPEDAAVDQMRLRVDDRTIEGKVEERRAARQRFERAADAGKRASLLEQERPNLFTMSVANIPPNGRIEVEIAYQQAVSFQDGRYSIRFPMAVTPRYLPAPTAYTGVKDGRDESDGKAGEIVFPLRELDAPKSNPMAIRVLLNPGLPIGVLESGSHKLMVAEPEEGQYDITLAAGAVASDRDFSLEWTLEAEAEPTPAIFIEETEGAAYLLAMVVPPKTHLPDHRRRPREAIFVIDTSGSMHGASMHQARESLLFALDRLGREDRFNIVAFSDKPRRLFANSRPADEPSIDAAKSFVESLEADGGTEIGSALTAALKGNDDETYLRQIILMTDGAVGNEAELLAHLRRKIGQSRLFSVAIGSAPNGYFMREAARIGRGAMLHISDIRRVQRQVTALLAKLERPALTDIVATFPHSASTISLPSPLPDLYHGEPVLIMARLPKVEGDLVIEGQRGGAIWRSVVKLRSAKSGQGIAKLWARARVDRELGRLREGEDADSVRKVVLDLALRHDLLTDYTSLVAVDVESARPSDRSLYERRVPANPPAGWTPPSSKLPGQAAMKRTSSHGSAPHMSASSSMPTVSIGVPTATPSMLLAVYGVLSILIGLLFWQVYRRAAP